MKSRLPLPSPDDLDVEQVRVYRSILDSRGSIDGPFLAWLHSPRLAETAQSLGAFCRYSTQLPTIESELLILVVAAAHDCRAEQQIHEPIAHAAGLPQEAIEHVRDKRIPALNNERLALLHELATQLLGTHRIDAATYERAETLLGIQALVEAIGVIGYYGLVACTLNAFEMVKE